MKLGTAALLLISLGWLACSRLAFPSERLSYAELRSLRYEAADGSLLFEARSAMGGYGRPVELKRVSPYAVSATLSSEDAGFWSHPGVDPVAVGRAVWLNLRGGRLAYGGSTVTQQLAGLVTPRPRSLAGKLGESLDAVGLELRLSKAEILEQYLNRAYYGRLAYGVEAAAQRYYGVSAAELELDQAALLAVLPRGPTYYNPDRQPARALARRRHILTTMADRGWISEQAAERAASKPLAFIPRGKYRLTPHLVDHLAKLRDRGAINRQALGAASDAQGANERFEAKPARAPRADSGRFRTSIDLRLQRAAEQRLESHLALLSQRGATQASAIIIDNATRQVRVWVGSRDYASVELAGANDGALSLRPPGSTLKPFVYALALESGASPDSLVLDAPFRFAGYAPRAASLQHRGWVRLDHALGSSLNTPAVLLAERVGASTLRDRLAALNLIPADTPPSLALALGGTSVRLVDLTNAYATLASGGEQRAWSLSADDAADRSSQQIFSPEISRSILSMLSDPRARRPEFGFETAFDAAELGLGDVAAKTGTSQSFCDNWAVLVTGGYSVGVWVGNFDGSPLRGVVAMQGAAPLARDLAQLLVTAQERAHQAPRQAPAVPKARVRSSWSALDGRPLLESPTPGSQFLMDSLLAADSQALQLSTTARGPALAARFYVNGQVVGVARRAPSRANSQAPEPLHAAWPLTLGEHVARVELLGPDDRVLESSPNTIFHVRSL